MKIIVTKTTRGDAGVNIPRVVYTHTLQLITVRTNSQIQVFDKLTDRIWEKRIRNKNINCNDKRRVSKVKIIAVKEHLAEDKSYNCENYDVVNGMDTWELVHM